MQYDQNPVLKIGHDFNSASLDELLGQSKSRQISLVSPYEQTVGLTI